MLYLLLDRPVIGRTGIEGRFNIHLEFAREAAPAIYQHDREPEGPPVPPAEATDEFAAPSIFAVVEKQLGLKLEKIRGPRDYFVIDQVERPSQN